MNMPSHGRAVGANPHSLWPCGPDPLSSRSRSSPRSRACRTPTTPPTAAPSRCSKRARDVASRAGHVLAEGKGPQTPRSIGLLKAKLFVPAMCCGCGTRPPHPAQPVAGECPPMWPPWTCRRWCPRPAAAAWQQARGLLHNRAHGGPVRRGRERTGSRSLLMNCSWLIQT